uniref:Carbohydrate kinase family protein n=1 Tax=Desulfobacca acetoxidans TaxID=60893 RepID=A0A7C3SKA1_9BACT
MTVQVVCLGAINLDLIYRVENPSPFLALSPHLRVGGEAAVDRATEKLLQESLKLHGHLLAKSGGGQAANTAFALARMGIPTALVGRVGQDADGRFLKQSLSGVNLEHLVQAGESGRAYVLVDPQGERTIFVAPNTNDELEEDDIPLEIMHNAQFVHLTSFAGEGPLRVQQQVAAKLRETDGPIITLDPGELYARRGRNALGDLLRQVETLLVTEAEWRLLGGPMDCHPDWAPPFVLIKRGARGVRLLLEGGYQDFPADRLGALANTLGAGDVFAAGYLAGRILGLNPAKAVILAGKAAAHSLQGTGREAYPDENFLRTNLAPLR